MKNMLFTRTLFLKTILGLASGRLLYQGLKALSSSKTNFKGKNVLITGGSRGLGYALAKRYAQLGANVIICARNENELKQAKEKLLSIGFNITTYPCDITDSDQSTDLIRRVTYNFGRIDVLVNNAGIMEVGPLDAFNFDTFQKVLNVNLIGMLRITLNSIPHMDRGSQIINITSIGAAVAVPHMITYSVSKFGALGFSLALDSELSARKISVTTVLPGLMRTGSFVHARFSGNSQNEFNWFALAASLPLLTISAERAATQIISAGLERKRFLVLSVPAKVLRILYNVFPETSLAFVRAAIRLLPTQSRDLSSQGIQGAFLRKNLPKGGITRLADRAGDNLNENVAA